MGKLLWNKQDEAFYLTPPPTRPQNHPRPSMGPFAPTPEIGSIAPEAWPLVVGIGCESLRSLKLGCEVIESQGFSEFRRRRRQRGHTMAEQQQIPPIRCLLHRLRLADLGAAQRLARRQGLGKGTSLGEIFAGRSTEGDLCIHQAFATILREGDERRKSRTLLFIGD